MGEEAESGLTIGGLAEAVGVSVETIRYYERRGLIDQPPRPAQGYRRYGRRDVDRIGLILRAKQLGFTLTQVRELIHSSANGEMHQILEAARSKLEEARYQVSELQRRQEMLSALVAACEGGADECLGLVASAQTRD